MPAGNALIGYLVAHAVADNVFMGAILTADHYGMPAEFRYTEPVRATRIQRVLYGEVLEKYILCDVIGANLYDKLEQKPEIVVVSDARLLPALGPRRGTAIEILETRVPPLKAVGARQDLASDEFLLQLTETGSPLRVRQADAGSEAGLGAHVEALLQSVATHIDVLEPQRRVKEALQMLWEELPDSGNAS